MRAIDLSLVEGCERMSEAEAREALERLNALEPEERDGPIKRQLLVYEGYDCSDGCQHGSPDCQPNTGGFHGVHCAEVHWIVSVSGRGAISMELHTSRYPESVALRGGPEWPWRPLGVLGLHYAKPPEDTEYMQERECEFTGTGSCWSDVTYLQSGNCFAAFARGGSEGVWAWLAEAWLPEVVK